MPFSLSMLILPSLRKGLRIAALAVILVWVGGCSTAELLDVVKPYKIDIIQGNFVSREMVERLKPGMSKDEVADVLGSPLLVSVFHSDRWDYVFTIRRQGVDPQSRRLTVFFKGGTMQSFEGDAMPSETEFASTLLKGR